MPDRIGAETLAVVPSPATSAADDDTATAGRPRSSTPAITAATTAAVSMIHLPLGRVRRGALATADDITPAPLPLVDPPSAATTSLAFWYRAAGSGARQRVTTASSSAGTSLRRWVSGVGIPASRFISIAVGVVPSNGSVPASISYAITPRA